MPTIDISEGVKDALNKLKEKYSCKTYNEVINLLEVYEESFEVISKIVDRFDDYHIEIAEFLKEYEKMKPRISDILKPKD